MKLVVCVFSLLVFAAGGASAATRTVCQSGCQYSSVQAAIDAAVPGDTILLRAGQTFQEHIVLRAKSSSATEYITIRSDAADSGLPAAGQRLIPEGKPGANVSRSQLARLIGRTGAYRAHPVIETELGAHHYRLQFLDIDGVNSEGYYTLIELGENSSAQTLSNAPHHIVFDRVYAHGNARVGQQRGIVLNGRSLDVINSYLSDFFSLDESQAIAGFNGAGPFLIQNNYLEAATENIMFGGSDPRTTNLVPSDIVIRGNHITKKTAWKNAVLATPASPSASATTGGALASGKHYFKVVARLQTGGNDVVSSPSAEVSATVSASGAVRLTWSGVANAQGYRIYRGTSADGENRYMDATGTSFTYTGSGEKSGTPRSSGHKWPVKNLLELKNAQRVTIDGNVIEHVWAAAQNGYALVFTPRNQGGTAPWSVVRDVTVSNNIVRHASQGMSLLGRDYTHTSQHSVNFRIVNNVFDDISSAHGATGDFLVITSAPSNVTVDHNTIIHTGKVVLVDTDPVSGFVYTNNFARHNSYGIYGSGCGTGNQAIACYFPSSVVKGNVLAGGSSSAYPSGNYFPSASSFTGSFVDFASGLFSLISGSPYRGAATDGSDIGVNWGNVATESDVTGGAGSSDGGGSGGDGGGGGDAGGGEEPPPATLPAGWNAEDIGVVGVSGSTSVSGGTFTVRGAGADVWGTADAFHYAYRTLPGDGTIVARVASLSGADAWTKVGVMIRASLSPSAAQGFMFVSKGKGVAFQRRKSNGATSVHSGATGAAPMWVKLTRTGNTITAHASSNGTSWVQIGSDTFSMPADVLVGLAVSSHTTSALATGTFDSVSVTAQTSGSSTLPAGWDSGDIGTITTDGSAVASGGTVTVKGAGADIWGTADAFHFAYRTLPGDGSIVARVASVSGADPWTKAGVMMRQSLDAGSAHAMMLISTGKGLAFQRRPVTGGNSEHTSGGSAGAPEFLKLTRNGTTVSAYSSWNGQDWRLIGTDTISFSGEIYVGLAVSSHETGALATGVFDSVVVED
ncbi:MAG: hypothetical protein AB7P99_11785 [Vicinamibacterales bacterium]